MKKIETVGSSCSNTLASFQNEQREIIMWSLKNNFRTRQGGDNLEDSDQGLTS